MLEEIVTQDRETLSTNQCSDELHVVENSSLTTGEFKEFNGERYYAIHNVDNIPSFFISVVSNSDHWLFISSNGGLTAGRETPEKALFPYITVDKIYESTPHTGSKTIFRLNNNELWEPFNSEHNDRFHITRNLYKNVLGNKLCFEEINHDLQLAYRYTWKSSEAYGFIRDCELVNLSRHAIDLELLDGVQNIMPASTPRAIQVKSSNLVDAYKWNELDESTGLAFYSLYSGITDRPEPCESLRANVVYSLGLGNPNVLLNSDQLRAFRNGETLNQGQNITRGVRGSYFINAKISIAANSNKSWKIIADVEQTQGQVVKLRKSLRNGSELETAIEKSVEEGSEALKRIMGGLDGFQSTAEENVTVHHYANVLFNGMRGGVFDDQYQISSNDFVKNIRHFNAEVYLKHKKLLDSLPEKIALVELNVLVKGASDNNLERLCYEYLPLTFGRRHGDPSRPWNEFAIKLKKKNGDPILNYQGNWRDIFQNWEALSLSYPEFTENFIAKFVNASTIDGFNPYRITKEGIDWEVEDPEDPWSYIGYWGDHQIIYLLKLLEISKNYHPKELSELLHHPIFCYANVPYRIKSFKDLLKDSKDTVTFDEVLNDKIEKRVEKIGADGKLLLDASGEVYLVNLLEKLLVPLLSKLSNLVLDGGIWLNTQRPEWNDANNALVGQGLSMVTLYYLRRYICFLQELLTQESGAVTLSTEVGVWLSETSQALEKVRTFVNEDSITDKRRFDALEDLGTSACRYRDRIYKQESFSGKEPQSIESIDKLLENALIVIDHSIDSNKSQNGLYHAYNLLNLKNNELKVDQLYSMLEGQVSVLSSGAIDAEQAVSLLNDLFETNLYQEDQHSFMLYPDRDLPSFLEKNNISQSQFTAIPFLQRILDDGNTSLVYSDVDGSCRFNSDLKNMGELDDKLAELCEIYDEDFQTASVQVQSLYEEIFNHKEFTGRSGGMFGFEGLGCIYWHMVSKLLLAVQEVYFNSQDQGASADIINQLGELYYKVREGIGFNKTPVEYGAFPTDPYSHTPKHAGAQQPGMTGQVKEEILTRFGELGVRVREGVICFQPNLLRKREFVTKSQLFSYLDTLGEWKEQKVEIGELAFTVCQTPIIYQMGRGENSMTVEWQDGEQNSFTELELSPELSKEIFERSGKIKLIKLNFTESVFFQE